MSTPKHLDPTVRHDAVLIFDAIDSNPNGDPDTGAPRIDDYTGQGIVSDASIKRKIRDFVAERSDADELGPDYDPAKYQVLIRKGPSLNSQYQSIAEQLGHLPAGSEKSGDKEQKAATISQMRSEVDSRRQYILDHFFDVRMFGAVMNTGDLPSGGARGAVTVGLARTVDPVEPTEIAGWRTVRTADSDKQGAQHASKTVIPYGLYVARISYVPTRDAVVSEKDLALFWEALQWLYEASPSAARPDVNVRGLHVFSHSSSLGSAAPRSLIDRVKVERNTEMPRAFSHYDISVDLDGLSDQVTYQSLL